MSSPLSAEPRKNQRIAIVGGGTAGHVYPALAIASAYRRASENVDLFFIGTSAGFEGRLVPSHGYRLRMVPGSPLFGVGAAGKLRAAWTLSRGVAQARHLLRVHGTKLVIGMGGYASAGVLLAAWSLRLRTVVHEANIMPGLTNRLFGRLADRVYLGFEDAGWAFRGDKILVTGNPVRQGLVAANPDRRHPPCPADRPVRILITGGSQGEPFLNRNTPVLLGHMADHGLGLEIRHQVGDGDPAPVRAAYARARLSASVASYIQDMGEAYRWADLAIARAGAGTITELATCGLPALLVPQPDCANDHQTINAIAFANAGAARWVPEHDWQAKALAARLVSLLGDVRAWTLTSERARQFATPNAARALVADCEALMAGQW